MKARKGHFINRSFPHRLVTLFSERVFPDPLRPWRPLREALGLELNRYVAADEVKKMRAANPNREMPWSVEELGK